MTDENRLEPHASWYANQTLCDRKVWYSDVAEIYHRVRPRYPAPLIEQAITWAELPSQAQLLELGCGPGIATVAWAERGYSVLGLEPSPTACEIARRHCAAFPQVEILNLAMEEWEPQLDHFHAVVAATSIHWIPADVAYPKSAIALRDSGALILLWNMTLQPCPDLFEAFQPIYDQYAPHLAIYETRATQEASLQQFQQQVLDSGYFKDLNTEILECSAIYRMEEYLGLLSTYSPYLKLPPFEQQGLFSGLRKIIQSQVGDRLELFYLSALQVAHKV